MTGDEFKGFRRSVGISQEGLANELGVSRKFVNEIENGAPIDRRTELAIQALASQLKLVSDVYSIEGTNRGTYAVLRRTSRNCDRPHALSWMHSESMLYGEFTRRTAADRWRGALLRSKIPRSTRKLERARAIEAAEREAGFAN